MADFSDIYKKLDKLKKFVEKDVPEIIGTEAVNHFKDSFQNEGFTDSSLVKWKDVKRRDASSSWYGFKYGSKTKRPGRKKRSSDSVTNYSPAATKRPILKGPTGDTQRSIAYMVRGRMIIVFSDKRHSKVINEGGRIKVFGKADAIMPQRKFMGKSKVLERRIKSEIKKRLIKITR